MVYVVHNICKCFWQLTTKLNTKPIIGLQHVTLYFPYSIPFSHSYFANLASCIAINSSQSDMKAFDYKAYFPDFLWLLRDVHLLPTTKNGSEVSPTEYLVGTVLRRGATFEASESDEVGRAILTFFPTVECRTLQPPSDSTEVLRHIAQRQESLNPLFNKQVEQLIPYLLQRLRPKHISAGSMVDGPILASMAEQYLKAINAPNAVPCIVDSWNVAVEMRCETVIKELMQEYIQEVEACIQEVGMPMEEDLPDDVCFASKPHTLLGIHRCVLLEKTKALLDQVGHLVNLFSETYNRESLVGLLEHSTVIFEEEPECKQFNGKSIKAKKVTGGVLFKYTQQNHSLSRTSCIALFGELYQKTQEKMLTNQEYSFNELLDDLKLTQLEYFRRAVGPAKWEVYAEKQEFIKTQEHNFRLLKGFEKKIYDAMQKNAAESARIVKLTDEMKKIQVQMKNNAELSQKQTEAVQKEHQKEIERLRREEDEQRAQEQRKFMNFEAALMKDMAVMSRESSEELMERHKKVEHLLTTTIVQNKQEMSKLNSYISKLADDIGRMSKYKFTNHSDIVNPFIEKYIQNQHLCIDTQLLVDGHIRMLSCNLLEYS